MTRYLTKRFYPRSALLKPLIKYFWVFQADRYASLSHKVLPVSNIDILFNLQNPMHILHGDEQFTPPGRAFFSGLQSSHAIMNQQGPILTIGAAFFPAGFFPFSNIPVAEFKGVTVGLDQLVGKHDADRIIQRLQETGPLDGKIRLLESFFLEQLGSARVGRKNMVLLNRFHAGSTNVHGFCKEHDVNIRTLERLFNKYVGTSPKGYQRVSRFQTALNRLLNAPEDSLTPLAHELAFYDQSHFIREFRKFTGCTPTSFLQEKRSIMQVLDIVDASVDA